MIPPKQNIVLNIDVHRLPMSVIREDEKVYRDAAKMVNQSFRHYQQKYPNESTDRLWVYVALAMAVNLNSDIRDKSLEPVNETLNRVNALIEQKLAEKQQTEENI